MLLKIKLYWPECDLTGKLVDFAGDDLFFLECSLKEAEEHIFKFLSDDEIKESLRHFNPVPNTMFLEDGIDTSNVYFLISRDPEKILPIWWSFPYSNHWGGDSPFIEIKEIYIKDLSELDDFKIEAVGDNITNN